MDEKTVNQRALEFVNQYGDEAYHVATRMTVMAVSLNDQEGAKMFSETAIELMQMGYHKKGSANERRIRGSDEALRDERGGA